MPAIVAQPVADVTLEPVHARAVAVFEAVSAIKRPLRAIKVENFPGSTASLSIVAETIANPRRAGAAVFPVAVIAALHVAAGTSVEAELVAVEVEPILAVSIVAHVVLRPLLLPVAVVAVAVPASVVAVTTITAKFRTVEVEQRRGWLRSVVANAIPNPAQVTSTVVAITVSTYFRARIGVAGDGERAAIHVNAVQPRVIVVLAIRLLVVLVAAGLVVVVVVVAIIPA